MELFIIILFFCFGGWFIGKFLASFIPKDKIDSNTTFITHNHITENHLHIDEKTLKEITDKK